MDEVRLHEPDPSWPQKFAAEAQAIRQWLPGGMILALDHIGSTAIPGMPAKPVIDILLTVPDLAAARRDIVPILTAHDYRFWAENPRQDRLFLVKGLPPRAAARTHHIHVTQSDGEARQKLAFRDHLRAHPGDAARYAALKRELAQTHQADREAYTDAKAGFVAEILARVQV